MACDGKQEKKEWVLVKAPLLGSTLEKLKESYTVAREADTATVQDAAPSIKALISGGGRIPHQLLESFPSLAVITNFGVGVDNIDLDYCRSHGIRVTNTPDILTDDVADLAILLMLAVLRRLCEADQFVRDGQWFLRSFPLVMKASGRRVGILGLGQIGMAIARRAAAFDCIVSYHGRAEKPDVSYTYFSKLTDLASNSEVLIVACSLCEDTKHIVGKEVLDSLGPEGILINIARGGVVDESELVKALVEKRLGGAGLDVFEHEPDVPKELLRLDNVVLSPHAGSATWETRQAMGQLVLDNLHAFFAGKPLLSPVV